MLVGDSDDCSHQACFPGGNTDIELDIYCRVLHAVLEKSKISAITWRGPGKAFTRKPVYAEAKDWEKEARGRRGCVCTYVYTCLYVSGGGWRCMDVHSHASSCLRWELEKTGKKYV